MFPKLEVLDGLDKEGNEVMSDIDADEYGAESGEEEFNEEDEEELDEEEIKKLKA